MPISTAPPVLVELPVLAVHRHEVLRLDEPDHLAQLVAVGVSRHVDVGALARVHDRTALREPVQQRVHAALVAGDHARRQDHGVAGRDRELLELPVGEPRERRGRLALRARDQHRGLVRRHAARLFDGDETAGREAQIAELAGEARRVLEAASRDRDAPSARLARVDHLLDPVQVRGERRHQHAASGAANQLRHARPDLALRGRTHRRARRWWSPTAAPASPRSPHAARRATSAARPSIGCGSSLKSPECRIVPIGVVIASAHASTIECVMRGSARS